MNDRWIKILLWMLSALAVFFLASAFYIPAKALLAQQLLENAWQQTLHKQGVSKPWPWADTWPIARLRVPAHGVDQIILEGDQGNSLAFAPGMHPASEVSKKTGMMVVSAHRDTHFRFLKDLQLGDILELQDSDGTTNRFRVEDLQVVNIRQARLVSPAEGHWLALVTCYPFTTINSDPELRYVVMAESII